MRGSYKTEGSSAFKTRLEKVEALTKLRYVLCGGLERRQNLEAPQGPNVKISQRVRADLDHSDVFSF